MSTSFPREILPGAGDLAASEEAVELVARAMGPARPKAWSRDDAVFLLEWPALRFAAAALPERRWAGMAMALERAKALGGLAAPARHAPRVRRALGLRSLAEAEAIAWRAAAGRTEHHIQILKVMSDAGWAPEISLEGETRLCAAMARGRGAIVWVAHFCFNTQITKMALHRAGYRVSHLSRPEHGFSSSAFGIRHLNPLRADAERKYLVERIVIDRDDPGAALTAATAALAENGVVSITAGAWEGRRVARGSLLGGRLALATGAPGLAQRTGAVLLPVFTTRIVGSTAFRVKIGEPLAANGADRALAIRAATAGFLAQLEVAIRAAPDQWRGWKYLAFAG